ncbi:MAG: carbon-nitrogen hydrolase family protein [Campylobacter sp.]|nr:carbon-nitrogen hydrolase family protein [Campylobacter sp.]MBO7476173.1 carbon-nitrogen hydrolase family protein [Campylobacter sp.]
MSKVCVLQLPTLSMNESRIDYYMKIAKDNDAKIVLLGEYVLNSFFTELKKMPKPMIKEQSDHKKTLFANLAKKYDLTIIAPIVLLKNGGYAKSVAKFSPSSTKYFDQNILINYAHWDEDGFFINSKNAKKEQNDEISFPIFSDNGVKYGILFGFEAHFDAAWAYFMKKKVDCVLLPCASTFDSNERWEELLKIRSWLNSVFIIRANRIGKAKFGKENCDFYGRSAVFSPLGEIVNSLKDEEGVLLSEISKKELSFAKNLWKFRDISAKKGLI